MVPGPVGEAPLVAAVLVVEVLRQLLDHLELPGLVLVVAVTNSRLDDIFVHRARRREAEVALEVVLTVASAGLAARPYASRRVGDGPAKTTKPGGLSRRLAASTTRRESHEAR